MSKTFYYCSACRDLPPQGFRKTPTLHTMCCHCKKFNRTWEAVTALDNLMWLQKRSFVTSVLGGTWTAANDNTLPAPSLTEANLYGGKHFDTSKQKDAAKYNVAGGIDRRRVHAMEQHAIDHGLAVPGAYIFLFDTFVGSDGETYNDFTPNTRAIRVDSVGTTGQHSHPIPEDRCGHVNHKSLVCSEIILAAENKDLHRFLQIAAYLKRIRATAGDYALNRNENRRMADTAELRESYFW